MSKKSGQKREPKAVAAVPPVSAILPAGGGTRLGLLRLAQCLMAPALGISLYLAYQALTGGGIAGCGAGSDCDKVLASRWAYWFSLPVSLPASLVYVAVLVASIFADPSRAPAVQARAWTALVAGAFGVLGAAFWFSGLQAVIIGSWCVYCMTAHLVGGVGALLLLLAAPFVIRDRSDATPLLFGVNRRAMPALLGILLLVPLVFGQYLGRPPAAAVATIGPASNPATNPSAPARLASATTPAPRQPATNAPARPSRKLALHAGRFEIELYDAPLLGRPDAPHVAVSLFDYTCAHCRQQHGLLKRVQATLSNELAIVLLPMPLDKACNPLLSATGPDHLHACEYARIGMAVWRAKPEVLHAYEDWFFAPEKPRPVAEVMARAVELTGRSDFEKQLTDPWIDEWLKLGRDLFKANWDRTGRNFLPMLNVGPVLSSGKLTSDEELYGILAQHLGLKRPPAAEPALTR